MQKAIFLTVTLVIAACWFPIDRVLGQTRSASNPIRGRQLGFVPKHLKVWGGVESSVLATGSTGDASPSADHDYENEVERSSHDVTSGRDCADCAECDSCQSSDVVPCRVVSYWGRAEYLLWWTKGMQVPALVTTGPTDANQDQAGVLPNAAVFFGDQRQNDDGRNGGRFTLGGWFDSFDNQGVEISYLFLEEEGSTLSRSSGKSEILARPFFNVQSNAQDSRLIAFPNVVSGDVAIDVTTDFRSGEALFRNVVSRSCGSQFEYTLGYRYAELEDLVSFSESTLSLDGPTLDSTINLSEQFESHNEFHGGQFGIRVVHNPRPLWSMDFLAKFALGNNKTELDIGGQTTSTTSTGTSTTNSGGLLTQNTNIGVFEDDDFTTITEIGFTLKRCLDCGITASIGYTFLYWSDVVRAADHVDTGVNPSQIPPATLDGQPRPQFNFRSTSFWAQGINFGAELKF